MFQASVDLVADCDLTFLHVFPFSPRPGTPAARMPPVPGDVIRDRARRLRVAGDATQTRHLVAEQGRQHPVLMEQPRMGRTPHYTEVLFDQDQPEGTIVQARITGHRDGRLLGHV
jgi:threonylcarbamoyladenosine tRNA methylthiotransferase MtaB